MIDIYGVKIAPAFNLSMLQNKKVNQKTLAQMYYDMYAIADGLAVEDIKIKARQMMHERTEDIISHKEPPRDLSFVEVYTFRAERTQFHLNNMIDMFKQTCEQQKQISK